MGTPEDDYWPEMKSLPFYNEVFPKRRHKSQLKNFIFKKKTKIDAQGIDLLERMLEINPYKRISVYEALNHPFFRTDPLPCQPSDMPKIAKECHEFNIRQAIAKRKKKRMEEMKAKQKNKAYQNNF
jgi:cyclin-dependent kinase 12/13